MDKAAQITDHMKTLGFSVIMSRGGRFKGTWTRNEEFIEVSEDYIAHDLVVNLYSASLDRTGYEKFETFADNVHDRFFHYSKKELDVFRRLIE